jgi:hypothetical protein
LWNFETSVCNEQAKGMKMSHREFTFEQIAESFTYEPETGQLWRRLADGMREVRVAGERWSSKGDRDVLEATRITFHGYKITSTHIIFMLMKRRWPLPKHVIDQRNGDVFDCRWGNLREVTHSQSMMNTESTGRWVGDDDLERGVCQESSKYRVRIRVNGVKRHFGTFATKAEANAVARKAYAEHHGEYGFEASRGEIKG